MAPVSTVVAGTWYSMLAIRCCYGMLPVSFCTQRLSLDTADAACNYAVPSGFKTRRFVRKCRLSASLQSNHKNKYKRHQKIMEGKQMFSSQPNLKLSLTDCERVKEKFDIESMPILVRPPHEL